jgi:hypothetical protein
MGASPKSGYAGRQRAGAGVAVSAGTDLYITCLLHGLVLTI